jgi:hypothetical protein
MAEVNSGRLLSPVVFGKKQQGRSMLFHQVMTPTIVQIVLKWFLKLETDHSATLFCGNIIFSENLC